VRKANEEIPFGGEGSTKLEKKKSISKKKGNEQAKSLEDLEKGNGKGSQESISRTMSAQDAGELVEGKSQKKKKKKKKKEEDGNEKEKEKEQEKDEIQAMEEKRREQARLEKERMVEKEKEEAKRKEKEKKEKEDDSPDRDKGILDYMISVSISSIFHLLTLTYLIFSQLSSLTFAGYHVYLLRPN